MRREDFELGSAYDTIGRLACMEREDDPIFERLRLWAGRCGRQALVFLLGGDARALHVGPILPSGATRSERLPWPFDAGNGQHAHDPIGVTPRVQRLVLGLALALRAQPNELVARRGARLGDDGFHVGI